MSTRRELHDPVPEVDRASPNDLTTLVTDRGPAPMNLGVVLLLRDPSGLGFDQVSALLRDRLPRVRRLRQHLWTPPPGCGRPVWVDDPGFDLCRHLAHLQLSPVTSPGDEPLLTAAADLVCSRLPREQPLWAARWVTGLADGSAALILVLHHALTDGVGGLALLAALTDSGVHNEPVPFPRPAPSLYGVAAAAWRDRLAALSTLAAQARATRLGLQELGISPTAVHGRAATPGFSLAAPTAINRPTGPMRRLTTVDVTLAEALDVAHARRCTLNDLVLAAVSGAIASLLRETGQCPDELVISVPISSRRSTTTTALGNQTGVAPVTIRTLPDPDARLAYVAAQTAARRSRARGSSAAPMGLLFRGLARLRVFQLFIDHQRLVHTFVTNVHGPEHAVRLAGREISAMLPMAVTPGNVGASFDVLSYAGRLVVTVVADPVIVPDQERLTELLAHEFARLMR